MSKPTSFVILSTTDPNSAGIRIVDGSIGAIQHGKELWEGSPSELVALVESEKQAKAEIRRLRRVMREAMSACDAGGAIVAYRRLYAGLTLPKKGKVKR